MEKIESFKVNHDKIEKGMYISRVDGDIVTYDIRMKKPNGGDYIPSAAAHTLEHLLATLARNSDIADSVIYVGPMGCRTGFYLILRDNVSHEDALHYLFMWLYEIAVRSVMYSVDGIPGATRQECGNYLEHDLQGACNIVMDMLPIIGKWDVDKMRYPE